MVMIMSRKLYYYNQNDYSNYQYNKPNGTKTTIAKGGCGVVSACIALNTLAQKVLYTVGEMRDVSQKCGARTNDGTNENKLLETVCKGNFSFKISRDINALKEHLQKGGVAICNQGNAYDVFSSQGHYVVAYEISSKNEIFIADPSNYSGKYSKNNRPNRIIKTTKYGCVVTPKELSKATSDRYPSFYLISLKSNKPTIKKDDVVKFNNENYCYKEMNKKNAYKISDITKFKNNGKAQLKLNSKIKVASVETVGKNIWIRTVMNKNDVYIIVYDGKKDKCYIK